MPAADVLKTTRSARTFPARTAASAALFLLNVWICRELFAAGFLNNLSSNEGAFATLGRFYRDHPADLRWFPWFNAGMPIEFAYQPLLPALSALTGALTGWTPTQALHFVLAVAYCFGPVTLFWFVYDWSKSLAASLAAAAAYSLTSPAAMLIPVLRILNEGHWSAIRFYNIVIYAEDPHNLALTLLPVALLFLRLAIVEGGARNMVFASVACSAVVSANAFGAVGIAIGALAMILTLGRGWKTTFIVGAAAWCWLAPWMPPSLIALIRESAWSTGGFFKGDVRAGVAILTVAAAFTLSWFLTKRMGSAFARFAILFAIIMVAIPVGYFSFDVTLVPLASRYQLELEMALCLVFGCVCSWAIRQTGPVPRTAIIAILLLAGARQAIIVRAFAHYVIKPIDITHTIEYKVSTWIDHNLPGQRTMVSGDAEWVFNLFSNNPQLSASHDPTAPNWMQRVAVFTIHSGTGAGDRDAEYSIFWLKAFGNQAIYVPGPASRDFFRVYAHPRKFDGLLPVLWHEEDDTIYRVPQRSRSFAHVIPRSAVVTKRPIHGLDIEPARAYVAALDDESLPLAQLQWTSLSRALISASMRAEQVVSVQTTWNAGWKARVADRDVPVRSDELGLIVIDPGCNGLCEIDLHFGVTPEAWLCRILSLGATLLGLVSLNNRD